MDNGQLKIDNARLPKGWEIKNIGDICEYDKQQGKINNRVYVGLEDIESNTGKFVGLNKPKIVKSTTFYFSNKHLLYGRLRPYLNKVLVPSFEGHCSTEIFPIKVNGTIDRQFLARWLMQDIVVDRINSTCTGTRMPRANMKEVLNFQIPIPPLPEQKRIVDILDKAFQAIDKAKENAEKNLQNAKELFESYLNEVFANGKLKVDNGEWKEKKLGEVCIVERGSSPRPIKDFITDDDDGVNWIKIGDTKNIEKYVYTTKQKITKKGAEKSRFVEEGDFILSNSMSFGKPYIIKTTGYIHDGWFKLKLHDFVDTEYLYQLLSSSYVNEQFHSLASGSVVKNINGDLVKKVVLPIPPLPEQKQLVKKLDALQAETKRLEKIYQQKIADVEELKKSILQKAFEGEL